MNKTVLITGANHGLGLSLTKIFLDNGFTVFAGVYNMHDESQIHQIKNRENLHLINMDISDILTIQEAAKLVGKFTKSIDILINNAGILSKEENNNSSIKTIFEPLDYDSIAEVINVNAIGTLRVTNVFSEFIKRSENKLLVNISSEAGSISNCERNGWFGYCMSKAALNMAGNIIHNELQKYGGQVLQIQPGYMQTYMNGEENKEATYSPDYSAEHIFHIIKNVDLYKSSKAVFLDLFGNKLDW